MKTSNFHVVYIPVSGVGIPKRNKKWLEYRIKIFKEYTLKSLLNQTERNFTLWLSFTEKERYNDSVQELVNYLVSLKMPFLITYNGLSYHDDKFSRGLVTKLLNIARILRSCWRERSLENLLGIKEIIKDKNKTLEKRLEKSLSQFASWVIHPDKVLLTRIDSDDMFHEDAVERIQKAAKQARGEYEYGALVFKSGLVYNKNMGELAEWNPRTNPPFHTIIFPADKFFNAKKHLEHYKGYKSHEDIPKLFKTTLLPNGRYCVLVHSVKNQISTIWNHPFRGQKMNDELLKDFGLEKVSHY